MATNESTGANSAPPSPGSSIGPEQLSDLLQQVGDAADTLAGFAAHVA